MSSPLPVNARGNNNRDGDGSSQINENVLAGSFDRAESIHRLGTSPIPSNFNFGTSPARSVTSHRTYGSNHLNDNFLSTSRPHSTYGDTLTVDMPEDEVAKAVKRHLVSTSPAGSSHGLSSSPRRSINSHLNGLDDSGDEAEITSVHQLPGGAITHDIYKWTESVEQEQRDRKKRSQSVGNLRHEISDPALANLKEPGGFRRHFVFDRAAKKGMAPPSFLTRSFVDFLALYGHFGGEDLSDDEDEDSDDEDYRRRRPRWPPGDQDEGEGSDERTALLRQAQENAVQGNATPRKVVFLLLKAFIGTGVMFLPKA
jgi:proton-coupled amino acid transporter